MTLTDDYGMVGSTIRKLYDSGLRVAILDALSRGPMRLADLRREVNSNAPNTSAKAKELEDMGLLKRDGSSYALTSWGKMVGRQMKASIDFYVAHERLKEFWDTHHLDGIPDELQDEIGVFKDADLLGILKGDQTYSNDTFNAMLRSINSEFYGISPIFQEDYPNSVQQLLKNGAVGECIVSEDIAKLMAGKVPKPTLDTLLNPPRSNFYVYKGNLKVALVVSESFMCLALRSKANPQIYTDAILCSRNPEALIWGKRLFEYYIKDSIPMELKDYK